MVNKLSRDNGECKCNLKFDIYYLIKVNDQWMQAMTAYKLPYLVENLCPQHMHSNST
jgi:hypothetical protein